MDPTPRAARFRAVFFGTPEMAVPSLRALHEVADVCGVVCQPDRPSGRGMKVRPPPVKAAALELGLPVYQPARVRSGELQQWISEREPDIALVLAYGRILPPGVLTAPHKGCLNLHASLLPRYRGAAPIQWALIRGERETGISLMQMDEGLDSGPVFTMRHLSIRPDETAGELSERLAELAATMTRLDVPAAVAGELVATPQNPDEVTLAPPLTHQDRELDWSETAESLACRIRGLSPRPGAHSRLEPASGAPPTTLRFLRARAHEGSEAFASAPSLTPGEILVWDSRILVGTGRNLLEILEAQLEGRRALPARDLVNGRALRSGDRLRPVAPAPAAGSVDD